MSQIIKPLGSSGPFPPQIPTEFDTQLGDAIPVGNVLLIDGYDINIDNDNGIVVHGNTDAGSFNPPMAGQQNEVTVYLTNRNRGVVSTNAGNPTATLLSQPLTTTPGVYYFDGRILAYDVDLGEGAVYTFTGAAYVDLMGDTFEIGSEIKDVFEAASMTACDFNFAVVGNNIVITVIGNGDAVNWKVLSNYTFQGL